MSVYGLTGRIDVMLVAFGEEDGAAAARVLLARDRLPTAVMGCSDHCGAGLVAAFTRAGVTVPGHDLGHWLRR